MNIILTLRPLAAVLKPTISKRMKSTGFGVTGKSNMLLSQLPCFVIYSIMSKIISKLMSPCVDTDSFGMTKTKKCSSSRDKVTQPLSKKFTMHGKKYLAYTSLSTFASWELESVSDFAVFIKTGKK